MTKHILSTAIMLAAMCFYAFSQDTHFSQFDAAPLYYNPALSGVNECHNRIYTNYKGQWGTYSTFMASYDQHLEKVQLLGGNIGLGGLVVADYSGENSYGNTQIKILPAYHYTIIPGVLRLSAGIDATFNIMSIDEEHVRLGKSIDPMTGKSTPGWTEYEHTTRFYADMGLGFNAQYNINPTFPVNFGVTFFRLFGSGGGGLAVATNEQGDNYRRFSLNANAVWPIDTRLSLLPSFIYTNQKMYNEMNVGTYLKCAMGEYTPLIDAIYGGMWYRVKDAIIFGLMFDKPINKNWTLQFGLSYDVTVSSYRASDHWAPTKNVKGDSFELSVKLLNCRAPIVVNPEGIVNDPFR
ncbi:MAG: PorP/SprF family type IX secretion system membrane protein [Bacteroidales bacterium]|nr:PorP/SprF family type IX secretion system membrane protein [Bacteroidales bacterium]